MKKLLLTIVAAFALVGHAGTLQLSPGLSEPVGGDGAIVYAAVLVSTNASATASVSAVYELPVFAAVERVSVVTNDVLTFVTNSVVVTNYSSSVTSNYTVSAVYGQAVTNYYTVATNTATAWEPRPGPVVTTTNVTIEATSTVAATNALLSLSASSGFAETNGLNRCLAPGARLLLTGAPLTIFLK